MVFNKLFKRTMALALTTVLATGMFAVSDSKQGVAKAEDAATTTTTLFKESRENEKVLFNKAEFFYDSLSAECFDKKTGYLHDGCALIPSYVNGMTIIETGYDITSRDELADGIVDIQTDIAQVNGLEFTFNVLSVESDGKVRYLIPGKDYNTNCVKDEEKNILKFTLTNTNDATDKYEFDVKLVDAVVNTTFNNASQAKFCTSKLFETKKAVLFSLTENGPFVDAETFIENNKNNMIDASSDKYDVYYKTISNYITKEDKVYKAKLMIGKYKIQESEIKWDAPWDYRKAKKDPSAIASLMPKYEYTGKAIAPKVTKIELSKARNLTNAKDIPSSRLQYFYTQYKTANEVIGDVDECVNKGIYVVSVALKEEMDYRNYAIPYVMENNVLRHGAMPFKIIDIKPSIAKAKAVVKKATYNKANQKAVVSKVTLGGKTLKAGTDYTVANVVKKNAGTYNVKITGIGNYKGSFNAKFVIAKKSIAKCKSYIKSRITADGNTILNRGKDYKEVVKKNKMYLVGMGNYTGAKLVNTIKSTKKK